MEPLRDFAHGTLPAALTRGGLRAGIETLVSRFSPAPEATAYFIVAESLMNVAKHAQASHAEVTASVVVGALRVESRQGGGGDQCHPAIPDS